METKFFHSVTLDKDACMGCINCIKRCPTEAIRVRGGKAKILSDRCIDCGECIRVCPHHAKKPIFDQMELLDSFRYKIALPAPALYGQFNNLDDIDIVLTALIQLGFDDVFEVAKAAELVSDATRKLFSEGNLQRPVISSACPTISRLIRVRFPDLIGNVLPILAPVEIAARMAKKNAVEQLGYKPDEVGAFFISPCPAKVTAVKMPLGTQKSAIDGVFAISDLYPKLISAMKVVAAAPKELVSVGRVGVGWGSSGGEAYALLNDRYLAADGIENVIKVLEDLEDEKYSDLDFVELNACSAGCVGGVLTVENPYIAKAKLKRIRKYLPVACNRIGDHIPAYSKFDTPLEYEPVLQLDPDVSVAMSKLSELQKIASTFQGIDCGACGAPSCKALAEDVVRGYATTDDCIFRLKTHMQEIASSLALLEGHIPQSFKVGDSDDSP
ncbi:[Fe-Fe] hydrogenase large subunit C-terminal domain-containing protein [Hydrogenoanaerobacterium sp.]|uniref:[Fe-Fe] hydrogenase large subunit C-terminal domain-containing protein n=1 Tax=Hydrogenoanaerobacterium sp. TaxID=2953763 RepID=UPI0028965341|nr:[Fe-Fe] hydrogenase large subunit C-terminal domain-containing protein [Hydrogenoanaerobacterium sp.]